MTLAGTFQSVGAHADWRRGNDKIVLVEDTVGHRTTYREPR
jgi:hypothetical protein